MKFGKLSTDQAEEAVVVQAVPYGEDEDTIFRMDKQFADLELATTNPEPAENLGPSEMDANGAARALAGALVANPTDQGVIVKAYDAGRLNIIAQRAGVLQLDVDRIIAVNLVASVVAFATLPNLTRVTAGTVVATIKVISESVETDLVTQACVTARQGVTEALQVRTAVRATATLIETLHPGGRIAPSGRRVLDERLDRLGAALSDVKDIPHDQDSLAQAITGAKGEVIVLLTVVATTSMDDVAPQALRQIGGRIDRFGIPVHPGYSLFIGVYDGRPVISIPASARSLALNGADWVLERIVCGLPVSAHEIAAMSVGGLLNEGYERGHLGG